MNVFLYLGEHRDTSRGPHRQFVYGWQGTSLFGANLQYIIERLLLQ